MPQDDSGGKKDNLPVDVTSLVGRRAEADEVRWLLSSSRLVTLTGVAGVGKTRLAVHVARRLVRVFTDGVWLVELADLADPHLLELTIMQSLGLQSLEPDSATALIEYLRGRSLVLVLDNCEHLVDACAKLVRRVLQECPEIRVLATSREALNVAGEHLFPVSALSVPDKTEEHAGEEPGRFEAVELFAQRAAAADSEFVVTTENRQAVAEVCRRLDGVPLAIELAAVRMRVLPVQELLQRLRDPERMLSLTGPREGSPRHHTLQQAIDWSYSLCSPPEQILWARLSAFPGGADLEAVEEVCAGEPRTRADVLETVTGLVTKSIVLREDVEGRPRFRMLEAIREYGQERLRKQDEQDQLRRRHRDYYLRLTESFEVSWFGPNQVDLFAQMRAEQGNLRGALDYCCTEPGSARTGMRMARALWPYWLACGRQREGRLWLDRTLAGDATPSIARAEALWADGYLTLLVGDAPAALRMLEEARDIASKVGVSSTLARAWYLYGLALTAHDSARGMTVLDEGLVLVRALAEPQPDLPLVLINLGYAACLAGDLDRSVALLHEAHCLCESYGERWFLAWALLLLGLAHWRRSETDTAITMLQGGLRHKRDLHDLLGIAMIIEFLAWCSVATGNARHAARLFGAGHKLWEPLGAFLIGFEALLHWHNECEQQARNMLGEHAFHAAAERTRHLTVNQIVAYALDETTETTPTRRATAESVLTRREWQVAKLVSEGTSNKDIANVLTITTRTVETHVEHILIKLGYTSRTRLAAWFLEQQATSE